MFRSFHISQSCENLDGLYRIGYVQCCLISPVSRFISFICFPFSLVPVDRQVSNYSCIWVTIPGVFETSGVVIIVDILTYGVIVLCVLLGSFDV